MNVYKNIKFIAKQSHHCLAPKTIFTFNTLTFIVMINCDKLLKVRDDIKMQDLCMYIVTLILVHTFTFSKISCRNLREK